MPREVIEFRGQSYPDRCSHYLAPIGDNAIILLGVNNLIFCNEDCLMNFIASRAADLTIREEVVTQCMLS